MNKLKIKPTLNICLFSFTGEIDVKVIRAYPKSHLILTFCATQSNKYVHLWTLVATRKTKINKLDYFKFSRELLAQGFNVNNITTITWSKC